ncbi:unnamed protein product [Phytophthora lilii]|uniref:Unnamed protein product n=1 Tax=Phytophthora lilii TaxID=2077276 RepID=A0A9W6X671_9STRA|nr:unnamed protein product [Phytophthora lilii]
MSPMSAVLCCGTNAGDHGNINLKQHCAGKCYSFTTARPTRSVEKSARKLTTLEINTTIQLARRPATVKPVADAHLQGESLV